MMDDNVTLIPEDFVPEPLAGEDVSLPETVEVVEVMPENRPFMTTSFYDYTVTEGLLLILVLLIFLQACTKVVKGGFSWLW